MKNKEDLKKELIKIDHKSYGMYKTLGGSYSFGNYIFVYRPCTGRPIRFVHPTSFEVTRDKALGFPRKKYLPGKIAEVL